MTDKERLIEILNTKIHRKNGVPLEVVIADYLLDNGIVPVVHCEDCIWRGREECAMFYRCECGEQHTWETDTDFCSYGAPK